MKLETALGQAAVCAALVGCEEAGRVVDMDAADAVGRDAAVGTPVSPDGFIGRDAAAPDAPADVRAAARPDAAEDAAVTWEGTPPPALSGGTLAVTRDGATAVVSDPDADRVTLVDLARRLEPVTLALMPGDEPGRVVEDGHRRVHVVLRGGGAVLSIDLEGARPTARRPVCVSPRGIAWSPAGDVLHVACASGELVSLPAEGGAATRRVLLPADLRDVVVHGNRLLVTRFRSAEVLTVDERGEITQRERNGVFGGSTPTVAWRAVPAPEGGLWLLRQNSFTSIFERMAGIPYESTGGESACEGASAVVRPTLVWVRPPFRAVQLGELPRASLAIDLALSPDGAHLAVAIPGNLGAAGRAQVAIVSVAKTPTCLTPTSPTRPFAGQVVAVAWRPSGRLLIQTRAPAALVEPESDAVYPLEGPSAAHPGHRLFHTNPSGTVSCASCHPEGEDDGVAWSFNGAPPRRTHYLRGGLLGTEPFHWDGDVADFPSLVAEVLVRRMGAPTPTAAESSLLARWIDGLRARPTASPGAAAVARGAALFRDAEAGCAGCHAGPRYSDGTSADVGTGGTFQVPSLLGLVGRAPYLHDGCAPNLHDALVACGRGERHGRAAALTPAQRDDLVAFLESL